MLTLREECGLRVLEYRVLRRILGLKRDEVTRERRKLHNVELIDLSSAPNIVQVIKLRSMRWTGHVAHMGDRSGVYGGLVEKPDGKRPHG